MMSPLRGLDVYSTAPRDRLPLPGLHSPWAYAFWPSGPSCNPFQTFGLKDKVLGLRLCPGGAVGYDVAPPGLRCLFDGTQGSFAPTGAALTLGLRVLALRA